MYFDNNLKIFNESFLSFWIILITLTAIYIYFNMFREINIQPIADILMEQPEFRVIFYGLMEVIYIVKQNIGK